MDLYFGIGSDEDNFISRSSECCQTCAMRENTEGFDRQFGCRFIEGESKEFGL